MGIIDAILALMPQGWTGAAEDVYGNGDSRAQPLCGNWAMHRQLMTIGANKDVRQPKELFLPIPSELTTSLCKE